MEITPITINVDFDGTVVTHDFPKVGKDIGAQRVLKALTNYGHKLILFTMRSNCEDNTGFSDEVPEVHNGKYLDDAVNWFATNDIPLHGIQTNPDQLSWTSSPKSYAQLMIDDSALGCPLVHHPTVSLRPYVDWREVERLLVRAGHLPQCSCTEEEKQHRICPICEYEEFHEIKDVLKQAISSANNS